MARYFAPGPAQRCRRARIKIIHGTAAVGGFNARIGAAGSSAADLEIEGDVDEASQIVERFLDEGTLQDAVNEHEAGCRVTSAVSS